MSGLIRVDYEVFSEFYRFGMSSMEFVGNDNFIIFGVRFYDELEDIVISFDYILLVEI